MTPLFDECMPEPVDAETADDVTLAAWMLGQIYTAAHDLCEALELDEERSRRIWAMAVQTFNSEQDDEFCELLNATDVDAVSNRFDELQGPVSNVVSLKVVPNAEH